MTNRRLYLNLTVGVFAIGQTVMVSGQTTIGERTLFDFTSTGREEAWATVNDTVMGGVSSSIARLTEDGVMEFSGRVSLDNNGGFASLRTSTGSLDLSAFDELALRIRGDGQRYALSIQTDYPIMAGAYYFSFRAEEGEWQEIRAPLASFEPRSFGRPIRRAPLLNAADIRSMGFIISDKQDGPFRLEVDWIKAIRSGDRDSPMLDSVADGKAATASMLIERAIARGVPLFNAGNASACAGIYELAAQCIVDLSGRDLPAGVEETLRAGLAKAERLADPAARAWALREAFDASLRILGQNGQVR